MIVITGATGAVGGEAARLLAHGGVASRLLVRNPAKAPRLPHAEVVSASYDDVASLGSALRPGDDVFMVSMDLPHDARMSLHANFVQAAAQARVGHIVYLSFLAAGPSAQFLHAQAHGETEQLIRATGIPCTFLRTSFYDTVTTMFYVGGVALGPGGEGRVSWVSRQDCGAVVAAVMRDPKAHAGAIHDVSGPEALSLAETSALIHELTGKNYRYVEGDYDPIEMAKNPPPGVPVHFPKYRRSAFLGIAAGEFGIVTDVVKNLTGRPARPLADFIRDHRDAYAPAEG